MPFKFEDLTHRRNNCLRFTVHGSGFDQSPITFHAGPLTSHFSHQCAAAAAAPALVFLQSQIVADPTKRITPSARKHSLYAITYEFV